MNSTQPIHDTITITKVIIDTVRTESKDSMELLTKMDSFYNNSWSKLIWVVTIAFTIIGLVVPLLIQWYQRKELKLSEDKLKGEIKNEVALALQGLEISSEENIKSKLELLTIEMYASLYHVQAHQLLTQKQYPFALRDYGKAVIRYLQVDNNNNLKSALVGFKKCLENCDKRSADKSFADIGHTFDKFIASLSKVDKHSSDVVELVSIYNKLNNSPQGNSK